MTNIDGKGLVLESSHIIEDGVRRNSRVGLLNEEGGLPFENVNNQDEDFIKAEKQIEVVNENRINMGNPDHGSSDMDKPNTDDMKLDFVFKQLNGVENIMFEEEDDEEEEEVTNQQNDNDVTLNIEKRGEMNVEDWDGVGRNRDNPDATKTVPLPTNGGIVQTERLLLNDNMFDRADKESDKKDTVVPLKTQIKQVAPENVPIVVKEPIVKMKDKKILVNLEDLEKECKKKEQEYFREIDFSKQEEVRLINYEAELLHPRKMKGGQVTKYSNCTGMGNFCYQNTGINDNIKELGLSMICYFKVLKVFTWCFFLISLLNLHLYYVYCTSNSEKEITGYRDFLFKTTIGNIASSKSAF
jgi:hypothetical protein